jgi:glycosyltransferase involved in cell wall biosynthesis
VSTRVGAEGLCLDPGEHLTVVEDIDDLVPALVAAVRNPGAARARAVRGRQRVLERYDWDVLAGQMEQAWVRCVTRYSKPEAQAREIP